MKTNVRGLDALLLALIIPHLFLSLRIFFNEDFIELQSKMQTENCYNMW